MNRDSDWRWKVRPRVLIFIICFAGAILATLVIFLVGWLSSLAAGWIVIGLGLSGWLVLWCILRAGTAKNPITEGPKGWERNSSGGAAKNSKWIFRIVIVALIGGLIGYLLTWSNDPWYERLICVCISVFLIGSCVFALRRDPAKSNER
jgi:hypothetical protein